MKRKNFKPAGVLVILAAMLTLFGGTLFAQGIPPIDRNVPSPLKKATFALG